ncbi:MAG: 3-methyl-2-oxobutanoate hydroxymethyltransferase [Gammaproteobacteria bacterium]|jgi:3-methyl-2-oxobutanoate hydroxymethyltransferase|nr:3-methyl-2-oxobutanoate hydroxymethyltransferase [Gammaproteobacteria bacterium]
MSNKITAENLLGMKSRGEKITSLTAYDASFAHILDEAGIEVVLVGDSLGMVLQGESTTLKVSMDDMVYHTTLVSKSCQRAMLVADMPHLSYTSPEQALINASRLLDEAGAEVVKLEGGEDIAHIVDHLTSNSVPVCGHVGLQPQSVEKYGGFKIQGREQEEADQILKDAQALEESGAMMIVLECIPATLATTITAEINIPTIGIGAGVDCDGQVLVVYDLLGISGRSPRMTKNFLADSGNIRDAVADYVDAVKSGGFPTDEHSY